MGNLRIYSFRTLCSNSIHFSQSHIQLETRTISKSERHRHPVSAQSKFTS